MKSFDDISKPLFLGIIIVVLLYLLYAFSTYAEDEYEEQQKIKSLQALSETPNPHLSLLARHALMAKYPSKFEKLTKSSMGGLLRGSLIGGLTAGPVGAVVGGTVWAVVNPFITILGY